jgi:acyl-coenzyme A synthetase/AMP-(fatty) acid ligase
MKAFPEKQFYNVYGPTEATGVSMYYHVKDLSNTAQSRIPIGQACANTEVFSLKEDGCEAGAGEIGELYIRGSGLSKGYWNDPEKTGKAFISNPKNRFTGDVIYKTGDLVVMRNDGNFEFIGRKDDQAKFMGYRIEYDEIRNALISMPRIKDAAALVLTHQGNDLSDLVAFVESENGLEKSEIVDYLASRLPHYMVPTRICFLDRMPRNDRGKVDKLQLHAYYQTALNT